MDNITKILINRGYTEKAAAIVAKDLINLNGDFKQAAVQWIESAEETVVTSNGYSTKSLMDRYSGMTYPAALLTINWLNQQPEMAKQILTYGIK